MNYTFSMCMKSNKPELVIERKTQNEAVGSSPVHLLLQVKPKNESRACEVKGCDLCNNQSWTQSTDLRKHGWKQRLVVVFNTITKHTGKTWLSLNNDIYPFFEAHWHQLWPEVNRDFYLNWRKKVQDSLSHSKDIFQSGTSQFGKKGYWRIIKSELSENSFGSENSLVSAINYNNEMEIEQTAPKRPVDHCLEKEFYYYLERNGIPRC